MDAHILAIRALAATLVKNFVLPIAIIVGVIFALVIGLLLWTVAETSPWLLLLLIPVAFIGLVVSLAFFIIYRTIRSIQPKNINKEQKRATKDFISNIEGYAELKSTPKIFIVWRIIMSALKRSPKTYMSSIIGESTKLKSSYTDLVSAFGGATSGRKKVKNLSEDN